MTLFLKLFGKDLRLEGSSSWTPSLTEFTVYSGGKRINRLMQHTMGMVGDGMSDGGKGRGRGSELFEVWADAVTL